MAEKWFVQQEDGTVVGPLSEREVSDDLLSGKIHDRNRVRQGSSGPWCDADRARAVFQQLSEVGWYVRMDGEVFGPFTELKLLELHRVGDLASDSEVRQGVVGIWKPAPGVLSLWQQQKVPEPQQHDTAGRNEFESRKWSIEPIRHVLMSLQYNAQVVSACRPLERLLLEVDPNTPGALVRASRTNGKSLGFLSENNSCQILANAERGMTHIALLHSNPNETPVLVAIVFCPMGATPEACIDYIDDQFREKHIASDASGS